MRHWICMAALSAALLAMPLWAQRGGHGGMAVGGARSGFVAHGGGTTVSHPAHGSGYSGNTDYYYYHSGHYPYYSGHYRYYRYGYPWWYRGYSGYPSGVGWYGGVAVGWSDSSNSYPADPYPAYAYPPPDNSNSLLATQQQEVDRLSEEVANLRAERAAPPPQPQPPAPMRSTVLVFRDRHVEQIEDYAIVGDTLWVFTQLRTRKIFLAQLDIPATSKANEDRGVDFQLPDH